MTELLRLVRDRPHLLAEHMAWLLGCDPDELAAELERAVRAGLLREYRQCCGQRSLFTISPAGHEALA